MGCDNTWQIIETRKASKAWLNVTKELEIREKISEEYGALNKISIKHLRNNKTAGADQIPAEFWKADLQNTAELLLPLMKYICENEYLPEEWRNVIIINLPKKSYKKECENGEE